MKATIKARKEITITHIRIAVAVRYNEEDIPNDFPLRKGEIWTGTVNIDTGKIEEWPEGKSGKLAMKVCDEGTYTLLNGTKQIAKRQDYVPNKVVPGEYGDYIDLEINEHGIITNWPKNPDVAAFFGEEEE